MNTLPKRPVSRGFTLIGASLVLAAFAGTASGQLYQPPKPYSMWDTWLCKAGDDYHLFFLQSRPGVTWDTIGRAVSKDLIHWTPLPPIPSKGPDGAWDSKPTLTGCTLEHDGRYALFYGSAGHGRQEIGVMFSKDLTTWAKHKGNPILATKGPHYGGKDWRDLQAVYDPTDKLWHGYVCARTAKDKSEVTCIAHLTSKDLIDWTYLPPVFTSPDFVYMEVPDYFELNGRHYILFSSVRSRKDTSGKKNASGTWYIMADKRDGPYRVPDRPLLIGSGRGTAKDWLGGRFDNYVGHTIPWGDTRLLYYQTVTGPVTWGLPTLVRQRQDGTLWLQYWPDLDKLITRTLLTDSQRRSVKAESPDKPSVLWLPVSGTGVMIRCSVNVQEKGSAGVVWRWDGKKGAGVTISRVSNRAAVVGVAATDEVVQTRLIDDVEGVRMTEGSQALRVMIRAHRAEVYLNDCWLLGTSLTDMPSNGKIGLLVANGGATFSNLRIDELEPWQRGASVSAANAPKKKIVLIAGAPDGHAAGTHEYEKDMRLLKHCLDTSPNLKGVRTELVLNDWPKDRTILDDADTIVFHTTGANRGKSQLMKGDRLAYLGKLMKRGVGLVCMHYTLIVPNDRGGPEFLEWVGGYNDYETKYSGHSVTLRNPPAATPASPDHPISRGWNAFAIKNEFYIRQHFRPGDPRFVPIATTMLPVRKPERQVIAWAVERAGGGRGFGFTGGHFHDNWRNDDLRTMILNAIVWTAKISVPKDGVKSTPP